MKKIFFFALAATAMLASCNKNSVIEQNPVPQEDLTGHYVTKSVVLGDSETKALASFAGEDNINDATIFVYQTNESTGQTIDYDVKYVSGNSATFDLYFSDQTVYKYSFKAWVNMGELTDEPVEGEILFSNEEDDDLQMRGGVEGIAEADAETVSIPVTRYVGKVILSEIKLDWKLKQNGLKTFELLEVYVSNAAETDAAGAPAVYNLDNVFTTGTMDSFLYDDLASEVLADAGTHAQDHVFYAYETATTEMVIKAQLDGEVMYYHFPIAPADNTYKSYSVTIKQIGASEADGELPEETIVVNTVTLNVEGWSGTGVDEDVQFGN